MCANIGKKSSADKKFHAFKAVHHDSKKRNAQNYHLNILAPIMK